MAPDSRVETYAAVRLFIDTWRWAGVPFYIRAGKSLPVTATEVNVTFKRPPLETFDEKDPGSPNRLRLRLESGCGDRAGHARKARRRTNGGRRRGTDRQAPDAPMRWRPTSAFWATPCAAIQALFAREDQIEAQWRIVDPVLGDVTPVHEYERNTWGPPEAASLMEDPDGWLNPR